MGPMREESGQQPQALATPREIVSGWLAACES